MVVGEKDGLNGLACMLGNNAKLLSDTDFSLLPWESYWAYCSVS